MLAALLVPMLLAAQGRSGRTTIHPTEIYPGQNVITIKNENGIDKIRVRTTSKTSAEVPPVSGCPTSVEVRVQVDDPTTSEQLDLTVYDCNGAFTTSTLRGQNWQIRKEYTGKVVLGRDTCLQCEIITTEARLVDSIVVNDPNFRVIMPAGGPPWRAVDNEFKYKVCYRPDSVENVREVIRIYIRRDQPSGGMTHYMIEKPVTAAAVPPPPPKEPPPIKASDTLPRLEDPTTFRNILMPTAESLGRGRFFAGTYDIAGAVAGYGLTDRFTMLLGSVTVPSFISRLLVVTVGGKYEVYDNGPFKAALGFQFGYSSTLESDITTSAPFGVLSYGDRANRISIAGGYSWKHHATRNEGSFERNAYIVAIGGDMTIARGMKLAAETVVIESSGILPAALTVRWFGDRYAFDAGLGADLRSGGSVRGTGTLSGEITNLRIAPVLSFLWKW